MLVLETLMRAGCPQGAPPNAARGQPRLVAPVVPPRLWQDAVRVGAWAPPGHAGMRAPRTTGDPVA
ncbi:hypothetical protein GCM10010388_18960 [Streptomyces mauvecolor]